VQILSTKYLVSPSLVFCGERGNGELDIQRLTVDGEIRFWKLAPRGGSNLSFIILDCYGSPITTLQMPPSELLALRKITIGKDSFDCPPYQLDPPLQVRDFPGPSTEVTP
jgi:hypothetical protein